MIGAHWIFTGVPSHGCSRRYYPNPTAAVEADAVGRTHRGMAGQWPESKGLVCSLTCATQYAGVLAQEVALQEAGKTYTAHIYPGANHGFHNDSTPRYDKAAADLAWSRTIEFFNENLRG